MGGTGPNADAFKAFSKYNSPIGNSFENCVGIGSYYGLWWNNQTDFTVDNLTLISGYVGVMFTDGYDNAGDDEIDMKNSIIQNFTCGRDYYPGDTPNGGTRSYTYNDLYNNTGDFCETSQGTGEFDTNPAFDTSTYGYGAYLIQPSALDGLGSAGGNIGAEVLYRYEDGSITTTPLWPWPMEGRILAESGFSPTYSVDQGSSETGGIWKTLAGVYGSYNHFPITTGTNITTGLSWSNAPDEETVSVYIELKSGACNLETADRVVIDTNVSSVSNADLLTFLSVGVLPFSTSYCWKVVTNPGDANESDSGDLEFTTTTGPPAPPAGLSTISYHSLGMTGVYDDQGATVGE